MDPTPLLRHLIATIGYRASRALLDAPSEFGTFEPGSGAGSPTRILAHVNAVLGGAHARLVGIDVVRTEASDWRTELDRTFVLLERIDAAIADGRASTDARWMPLLQGPLADVLTHVGQLAMLRRLAGRPIASGASYALAPIEIGRVRYA